MTDVGVSASESIHPKLQEFIDENNRITKLILELLDDKNMIKDKTMLLTSANDSDLNSHVVELLKKRLIGLESQIMRLHARQSNNRLEMEYYCKHNWGEIDVYRNKVCTICGNTRHRGSNLLRGN